MTFPIFTLLSLLSLHPSKNEIALNDSLIIFDANRRYHYQALYISPAGDTLSRENIILAPTGQPWRFEPKVQTAFKIHYHYTTQDSLTFLTFPNPESKPNKAPKPYTWYRSITTGAIENKEQIWMHPIRSNQYSRSEIAPFPMVKLASLQAGGRWENNMTLSIGWGAFKGKKVSYYEVEKQVLRQYGNLKLTDCWLIHATGKHSTLGTSYLDFYFHPKYGFTEMTYRFYDGTKFSFVLEQVINQH